MTAMPKCRSGAEARAKSDAAAAKEAEKAAAARDKAEAREQVRYDRGREPAPRPRASNRQTPMEALTKSVLRTAGSTLTRELLRGVLGGLRRR